MIADNEIKILNNHIARTYISQILQLCIHDIRHCTNTFPSKLVDASYKATNFRNLLFIQDIPVRSLQVECMEKWVKFMTVEKRDME